MSQIVRLPKRLHRDFRLPGIKPVGPVDLAKSPLLAPKTAIWVMNEGAGLPRSMGVPAATAVHRGAPAWAVGSDRGVDFGDSSSYSIDNSSGVMTPSGPFTVFAKIRRNGPLSNFNGILSSPLASNNTQGWFVGATSSNALAFYVHNGGWANVTTAAIDQDADYWVIATYEGSSIRIYLNKSLEATTTKTVGTYGTSQPAKIGEYGESGSQQWNGIFYTVGITHRAWSSDEISGFIDEPWRSIVKPANASAYFIPAAGGGTAVTPASASQPQSVSSPTLTQHNALAVDSVSQAQTASQPTLNTASTLLSDPVDQAQTATQPTLTQHSALPVDSTSQAQTATAATLAQHNILLVDNVAQLQALGSPSLSQHQALAANPLTQAQTATEPTLTQAHILAVAGLSQTQTATAVTLAVAGVLSPAPLTQTQTASVVTLIQAGVLGADALVQSQTVTDPALLAKYTLIVDALAQSQPLEQSTLSIADVLAAAGLTQTQSAGAVALTQHGVLAVDSLTQAQLLSISQGGAVLGWLDGTLVIVAALGGTLTINPAR